MRKYRIQFNKDVDGGGGIEPPAPINLDALSAPEGAASIDFTFDDPNTPLNEEALKNSLPNLDDDTNVADQQKSQLPDVGDTGSGDTSSGDNVDNNLGWLEQYVPILDKYRAKFGENFVLPAGTTEDTFAEALETEIAKQYAGSFDPRVMEIQNAINEGLDPDEYFASYKQIVDYTSLPDNELVKMSLVHNYGKTDEKPSGWDEDKVNSVITKMEQNGMLEIEAERIRSHYDSQKQDLHKQMIEKQKAERLANEVSMKESRNKQLEATIKSFNELDNVLGIPLSRSEKADFQDTFRFLVTPDENGVAPATELLRSNENLAKVLYLLQKGDSKIKNAIDLAKAGAKKDFLGKLDPEPRAATRNRAHNPTEIDFDALAAPERYI